LQAGIVRLADQLVEILQRPEQRIDAGVIGDVVAEIGHRRGKTGDSQTASTPSRIR
jgi:hydrogenase maturation factor